MMQAGRLWRTVRHLTFRQIVYQARHRLRKPARLRAIKPVPSVYFIGVPAANKPVSWKNNAFTFLNQSVHFDPPIDWNYSALGKLWTYNLTYFDYLNQPDMQPAAGVRLMQDFINQTATLQTGLEAYPTSIRIMNWVQFLSRHRIQDKAISGHLAAQVGLLSRRVEYHLSGNHLLENGFALLAGALYFRQKQWYTRAVHMLRQELTVQILPDGGHYERSVVYHQLLFDRVLDAHLMLQADITFTDVSFLDFLTHTTSRMYSWLNHMTFRNGDIPMMNDAAPGLAFTTAQLRQKAEAVLPSGLAMDTPLAESGYRMVRQDRYELLANVGTVGPAHQPGHAHADTFTFVLYVDNQPIIVDTGTSTYESSEHRQWERSTAAHTTVTVGESSSSEVWASFRVGRRARVAILTDSPTILTAQHDGYRQVGCLHERVWRFGVNDVLITDRLLNSQPKRKATFVGVARFYFHPYIEVVCLDDTLQAGPIKILLQSATKLKFVVTTSQIANGFNRTQTGYCLEVYFTTALETRLLISG